MYSLENPFCQTNLQGLPRFLPQGDEGVHELIVRGDDNRLYVCPASALPTAPDLAFFRRAAATTTR